MVNTGQGRRRLNARAALRTVAIAGRAGERDASPGLLPDASGADASAAAASGGAAATSAPGGAGEGQPEGSQGPDGAATRPGRPLGRPPGRGRGRGRGAGSGRGRGTK